MDRHLTIAVTPGCESRYGRGRSTKSNTHCKRCGRRCWTMRKNMNGAVTKELVVLTAWLPVIQEREAEQERKVYVSIFESGTLSLTDRRFSCDTSCTRKKLDGSTCMRCGKGVAKCGAERNCTNDNNNAKPKTGLCLRSKHPCRRIAKERRLAYSRMGFAVRVPLGWA